MWLDREEWCAWEKGRREDTKGFLIWSVSKESESVRVKEVNEVMQVWR